MTPIKAYIEKGRLPDDPMEAKMIKQKVCKHTVIEGRLFNRGFSTLLLKCLDPDEAAYTLEEVHEGIAEQHLGGRALERKISRTCYY